MKKKSLKPLCFVIFWLAFFAAFVYASIALFFYYKFYLHSDGAIKTVLAQLAIYDGRFVPDNWVFANGDIFLLSPYIFSVIVYPWLGLSYLSNAAADWLGYLFLLPCVYGACRAISPKTPRAAIVAAVVAAGGLSASNFEFVIAQGAYSMIAAMALCLFSLACIQRPVSGARHYLTLFLTFSAALLTCVSNPLRGSATAVVPLVVGFFVANFLLPATSWRERINRLLTPTIYVIVAGALVGTTIYRYWLFPDIFNFNAVAQIGLASFPVIIKHALKLPNAWFQYFLVSSPWQELTFSYRILQCIVWLMAVGFILAPLFVVLNQKKHSRPLFVFSWIMISCYGVSFSALIFSPVLFQEWQDIRYATSPIYGSLCIVAILLAQLKGKLHRISTIATILLVVAGVWTASLLRSTYGPNMLVGDTTYNQRAGLIRSLERRGVGTILATYWHSHVITVSSNNKVVSYPVVIGNSVRPYPHHMPRHVFYGYAGPKEAIVLTKAEADTKAKDAIQDQFGEPNEKFSTGSFIVWIYDSDIVNETVAPRREINLPIPRSELGVRASKVRFATCDSLKPCIEWIDVKNIGSKELSSVGSLPLRIGISGTSISGQIITRDAGRADFPTGVLPGSSKRIRLILPTQSDPDVAGFQICLVQEQVNWLCDRTQGPSDNPKGGL